MVWPPWWPRILDGVPASAQQRPLVTEDPETVGSGRILVEAGIDYERDAKYPLSGLDGNLLVVPTIGVSIGISSIADCRSTAGSTSGSASPSSDRRC